MDYTQSDVDRILEAVDIATTKYKKDGSGKECLGVDSVRVSPLKWETIFYGTPILAEEVKRVRVKINEAYRDGYAQGHYDADTDSCGEWADGC